MTKTKRIIIFGTGGNCIDILDTLNDINTARGDSVYECAGFLDDDASKWGKEFFGARVLGPLVSAREHADCFFVNGIGSPANFYRRREIIAKADVPLERFETVIHPTASVSRLARLGRGVVVFQNATITNCATLGDHVIILPAAVVSHDDVIGAYTLIATGACVSGGVTVGEACYLGANASIIGNVTVGKHCLIGMGSVVLHDVPENSVMVGNPARFLRKVVEE
jgi:sugar O-acyltransferase (sialic acid O-acetyltransferase NeuD family)